MNIALLSVFLWPAIRFVVRSEVRWKKITGSLVILACMIFPLNFVRLIFLTNAYSIDFLKDYWFAFLLLGVYMLFRHLVRTAHSIVFICLVLSPFAALTLGQAVWMIFEKQSATVKVASVQRSTLSVKKPTRIVWLLMDELDLDLTYLKRPMELKLPEFDRFRHQAFFALNTNSYSRPTLAAIPSFLIEKIVQHVRLAGPSDLHLTFDDVELAKDGNYLEYPNFFSEAAQFGARAAIIGLYHPYCRQFSVHTVHCERYSFNTHSRRASKSIAQEMLNQIVGITPLAVRINAVAIYSDMEKAIIRYAGDS
ncbi:MAG: hypothetical protein GKS01_12060 [Alphaproteobacteria bacterium]|nr:hypothetical protein [Alphaproteobacteria bacterium]